jgi:hypothetical protein
MAEADPAMVAAAVEYGLTQLQAGNFPQLTALFAGGGDDEPALPPMTEEALSRQLERGLAALLDGLAVRMNIG